MNYALLAVSLFLVAAIAALIFVTVSLHRRGIDVIEFDNKLVPPARPPGMVAWSKPLPPGVRVGDAAGPANDAPSLCGVAADPNRPAPGQRPFVHGVRLLEPGERVLREMERGVSPETKRDNARAVDAVMRNGTGCVWL